MVPDHMVKDIASFGVKIIACGDEHQLPPIGGKPAFLTGNNTYMLTEIMRQAANDPIVYLSHRALSGEPIHNGMYGNKVLVINEEDFDPQMYGLVDVVCTCNNKRREEVNNQIRSMCRYESPLPYYGERIICRNNNWNITYGDIALANGLQGYAYSMPKINAKDRSTFYMDFKPDMCNYVFTDLEMNIEYFNAPYDIKQQMKSLVKSKQNQYVVRGELFEYAYACTVWVLQGGEFNRVMFIEEPVRPQLTRPLIYTAITRAKGLLIYVKRSAKKVYSGF
jgi:exodeoxyribonuclease-5